MFLTTHAGPYQTSISVPLGRSVYGFITLLYPFEPDFTEISPPVTLDTMVLPNGMIYVNSVLHFHGVRSALHLQTRDMCTDQESCSNRDGGVLFSLFKET